MQSSNKSDQLTSRIQSGLSTVQTWHKLVSSNTSKIQEIRESIPLHILYPQPPSSSASKPDYVMIKNQKYTAQDFIRKKDMELEGDDLLLHRFSLYFQKIMTWVNEPPCTNCGAKGKENVQCVGVRGPISQEEKEGGASRVELYRCAKCNDDQNTTFPRYNNPLKLFETKKGRCGEYANLFGFLLMILGYDVRYISDFTDHVWVEVWSHLQNKWIHVDGCEAESAANSMYEYGWGKKLNYILAFTIESVTDVTKRYTRKFDTEEFQKRRREYSENETMGELIIAQANAALRSSVNKKRLEELDRRHDMEIAFWKSVEGKSWDDCKEDEELYQEGRLSGSLAWRYARNELGDAKQETKEEANATNDISSEVFHVEHYHPMPHSSETTNMTITLKPPSLSGDNNTLAPSSDCITASSIPCASGLPNTVSAVILDEQTKCILQSRYFVTNTSLLELVESLPDGRIILLVGSCEEQETDTVVKKMLELRLGGLTFPSTDEEKNCLLYAGQVNYSPSWSTYIHTSYGDSTNVTLSLSLPPQTCPSSATPLKICRQDNMIPSTISKRLSEDIMPLQTQSLATGEAKHVAFLNFMKRQQEEEKKKSGYYVGYTTSKGAPIYLFTAKDGFPFRRCGAGGTSNTWYTFHYLPEPLVSKGYDVPPPEDEENAITSSSKATTSVKPKFDIPIETTFFTNLLGPNLLFHPPNNTNETITLDTETALSNTRLIALYFSAHWCPPCRRFTPLLIEMYNVLKEDGVLPTHGLEIIFVSSDRDSTSFENYYNSMPWLAIPFNTFQSMIKGRFGVRGIPALIVLDSMTGDIVVSMDESRGDVIRACQGGDEAIEQLVREEWIGRKLSMESRAIVESLELSCLDDEEESEENKDDEQKNDLKQASIVQLDDAGKAYLTRSDEKDTTKEQTNRVKQVFTQLITKPAPQKAMDPNAAAAKAIQMVAKEQKIKHVSNPSERIKEIFTELTTPQEEKEDGGVDEETAAMKAIQTVRGEGKGSGVIELQKGPLDKAATVEVATANHVDKTGSSFHHNNHLTPEQAAEQVESLNQSNSNNPRSTICLILTTAKKYFDNIYSNPSSFKYRHFKVSNKVFDRITSTNGGLDLITSFGFMVYFGGSDYMACVPLGMDLDWMKERLDGLLDVYDVMNDGKEG